jgi:lia operon protein LiaG
MRLAPTRRSAWLALPALAAAAVDLTVPAAFGADVQIGTGSGGITVDVPVTRRKARRSSFRGRTGDGNGRVTIDTGSGAVRIRRG